MFKRNKFLILTLISLCFVFLLAGCGKSKTEDLDDYIEATEVDEETGDIGEEEEAVSDEEASEMISDLLDLDLEQGTAVLNQLKEKGISDITYISFPDYESITVDEEADEEVSEDEEDDSESNQLLIIETVSGKAYEATLSPDYQVLSVEETSLEEEDTEENSEIDTEEPEMEESTMEEIE